MCAMNLNKAKGCRYSANGQQTKTDHLFYVVFELSTNNIHALSLISYVRERVCAGCYVKRLGHTGPFPK